MSLSPISMDDILKMRNVEEDLHIVVLGSHEGCHSCEQYEPRIEAMASKYPDLQFYRLNLEPNNYPLFAPPVIPFVVGMTNGMRQWEALGALFNTGPLESIIDDWIETNNC